MELQETTVYKLKVESMDGGRVTKEEFYMTREEAEEHNTNNFTKIEEIKAVTDGVYVWEYVGMIQKEKPEKKIEACMNRINEVLDMIEPNEVRKVYNEGNRVFVSAATQTTADHLNNKFEGIAMEYEGWVRDSKGKKNAAFWVHTH